MGEVFAGRYELADPIGRGGVGAVWRAWDHRRRRYVAAKVLQQRDAHALLRFVREQALRIDHPHVLAPASWAADDDQVLFTMDLVGGGSLVHLVGDYGPLPPVFVCTLLDQLLSGLAAVHAEGVVHRDIKPANVLLEATGTGRPRLRLSDFGIAMRFGEPRLTETNLVVGTPGYLAPEQLLGSEPDFPADLFAVGLVALYLLEGAKPDAKALVQYFMEHGTPGPPKGVPEPLWQVVATLLQPDPAARFRTATGARKALASAAELLPEPGPDDELIEIFDQLGPLPPGFGADGPLRRASGVREGQPATGTREAGADGTGSTARPASAAVPLDPRLGDGGTQHSVPSSMSDTGSFHLPPPQPTPSPQPYAPYHPHEGSGQAQHGVHPAEQPPAPATGPAASSPHAPTHPQPYTGGRPAPAAPPLPVQVPEARGDASTASYTARDQRFPAPAQPVEPRPAPGHGRRARRASRRPGPPAKAAIPILLLALACYAVGFWALTRV
ncbi:serine/threonine protein kinase [Streptomyces cellostaticus]|uniref:non-specific serine/threonine protein kinase n=1 Tax=Streptomyces cellostaticus TaxID=67285 RepID=A0A101NK97_9ACTN|nr:serine/threonine-protein kinase [Streptomyces cellostaticus]KUM94888.1 serine/threonine protein kinase [Streptomyces cellostaticus]GHI06385.1 serine/threonine protein kinase [Streptomyces cellostaticus]